MAEVTCTYCCRTGDVQVLRIVGKRAEYVDRISHAENCPIFQRRKKAQPRHLRKKAWRGQERRAAAVVGARETPASGALGEDGDARKFHGVRLECKQTSAARFKLSQAVWGKLVSGARRADEIPILQVELRGPPGLCRFYVVAKDSYEIKSQELAQKYVRRGLHLTREDLARTPFHVTLLDPHPVVVTERQLLEVLKNETE